MKYKVKFPLELAGAYAIVVNGCLEGHITHEFGMVIEPDEPAVNAWMIDTSAEATGILISLHGYLYGTLRHAKSVVRARLWELFEKRPARPATGVSGASWWT